MTQSTKYLISLDNFIMTVSYNYIIDLCDKIHQNSDIKDVSFYKLAISLKITVCIHYTNYLIGTLTSFLQWFHYDMFSFLDQNQRVVFLIDFLNLL